MNTEEFTVDVQQPQAAPKLETNLKRKSDAPEKQKDEKKIKTSIQSKLIECFQTIADLFGLQLVDDGSWFSDTVREKSFSLQESGLGFNSILTFEYKVNGLKLSLFVHMDDCDPFWNQDNCTFDLQSSANSKRLNNLFHDLVEKLRSDALNMKNAENPFRKL